MNNGAKMQRGHAGDKKPDLAGFEPRLAPSFRWREGPVWALWGSLGSIILGLLYIGEGSMFIGHGLVLLGALFVKAYHEHR